MGNCRSNQQTTTGTTPLSPSPSKTSSLSPRKSQGKLSPQKQALNSGNYIYDGSSSTGALIQAILPIVFPIVQCVASQQCIKEKMILRNEKIVEQLDEANLPIGPIEFSLDHVCVVDCETLHSDQKSMPEFAWPEQERVERLQTERGAQVPPGDELLVLDIMGVSLRLNLAPGVEFVVPVEGPFGIKANLEIGTGGSIQDAWVQIDVPKLRVWFVNNTRLLHVAFLDRPSIVPNLHVNADRGKGDFFSIEFAGGGGLDDVIESVLCGFGPSSRIEKDKNNSKNTKTKKDATDNNKEKTNWVADALGKRISTMMERFAGVGGNRPLEVDLNETIQASIDSALGKPRPVETVKADIAALEKELELAKEFEKEKAAKEKAAAASSTTTQSVYSSSLQEEKKDDMMSVGIDKDEAAENDKLDRSFGGPLGLLCGIGA